nr:hypothetical protein [Lachnotalea glycerini]
MKNGKICNEYTNSEMNEAPPDKRRDCWAYWKKWCGKIHFCQLLFDLEFLLGCCTSVLYLEEGKVKDYYSLQEMNAETKLKKYFIPEEEF